jgi:hypothetical protein
VIVSLSYPTSLVDSDIANFSQATQEAAPRPFDPGDWKSVRAQFLLLPDLVHLPNFYLASNPTPVRDAITNYRRAFDENPHSFLDDNMFAREEDMLWRSVCAEAAEYVGGQASEIALTGSTTMGQHSESLITWAAITLMTRRITRRSGQPGSREAQRD